MIFSNVVKENELRKIQKDTLKEIADSLVNSFGPMGSNTEIYDPTKLNQYSKDGYTILKKIKFHNVIEQSVQADLVDITQHIVKNVGDGTTSAILLAESMFNSLYKLEREKNYPPYELIHKTKKAIDSIKEIIRDNVKEFNSDVAYDIAMISSNGNEEVANMIKKIYEDYGNDVFIDVGTSTGVDTMIKIFDGMTLDTGYSDTAYINNSAKGTCTLRNPRIYQFDDPIDTPEQMSFLSKIISHNISEPMATGTSPIPTVIMAPFISRDMGSFIGQIVNIMYSIDVPENKPPLLIITNIHNADQFHDICRMCGCKAIKKYLNATQQKADIDMGIAPTLENIHDFCGSTELIESDLTKTKFINPEKMFEEDKVTKSVTYNTHLEFLEAELKKAYEENRDANTTGNLKRRLNSLKANMVELLIGGVSASDRDSLKDLVEDTVLNCRSAARYGVGYAANFEGLRAVYKLSKEEDNSIYKALFDAYFDLVKTLYFSVVRDEKEVEKIIYDSLDEGKPMNLRTKELDSRVICSIKTDEVILEALSNILSLMITCNQFITPNPVDNVYRGICDNE